MIFNSTKYVYTLKIRYSGEEDDVFVFYTKEKAEAKVYDYFECYRFGHDIDALQEHLFSKDIGYFDIVKQEIN
jgi:hypothetical protein